MLESAGYQKLVTLEKCSVMFDETVLIRFFETHDVAIVVAKVDSHSRDRSHDATASVTYDLIQCRSGSEVVR